MGLGAGAAGGALLLAAPWWLVMVATLAPAVVAWLGDNIRAWFEWRRERSDWDWLSKVTPAVRRDALELRRINTGTGAK